LYGQPPGPRPIDRNERSVPADQQLRVEDEWLGG